MSKKKKQTEYKLFMVLAFAFTLATVFMFVWYYFMTLSYMGSLEFWDAMFLVQPVFVIVGALGITAIALSSYANVLKNKR